MFKYRVIQKIGLLFIAVIYFSNLSYTQERWQGKIKEIEGVKYIHNFGKGLWEDTKKAIFTEEFSLGVIEGEENQIFAYITDIEIDSKSNLYILDKGNYRIQKFDGNGKYLHTIGTKGKGPGEFIFPSDMGIDSKDNIFVIDKQLARVSSFTPEGQYINSFTLNFQSDKILIDSEDNLILVGEEKGKVFHVFDKNGTQLSSFGEPIKPPVEELQNFPLMRIPSKVFIDQFGSIYHTPLFKYEIRKYQKDGKLIQIIDRKTSFFAPPRVKKVKFKSGATGIIPVVSSNFAGIIKLDDKGIIGLFWYRYSEESKEVRNFVDFYNNEGKFLGSFDAPEIAGCFYKREKLYGFVNRPFPRVIRYTVKFVNE